MAQKECDLQRIRTTNAKINDELLKANVSVTRKKYTKPKIEKPVYPKLQPRSKEEVELTIECTSSEDSERARFEAFLNEKPPEVKPVVFLSPRRIEKRKKLSHVIM